MIGLLAATAAAAAAPAIATPADLPRYESGDAFVFSDGRVERVVKD